MLLKVNAISISYNSHLALKEVSFGLEKGSILGVIGPNGAGKSTLIRAISGILPIAGGTVELNGIDASRLSTYERARLVAVVPQAQNLPAAFTACETILLGRTPHLNWLGRLSPADEEAAWRAMQRTDTLQLADRRMGELSGGEAQRVLLARALAQDAPLLLLDEPTSHLDLQYQVSLLGLVRDLAHQDGYTVLLALHDLNMVARFTDRVCVLSQGKLLRCGLPQEVLEPGFLSQVYRVPFQVYTGQPGEAPVLMPRSERR